MDEKGFGKYGTSILGNINCYKNMSQWLQFTIVSKCDDLKRAEERLARVGCGLVTSG